MKSKWLRFRLLLLPKDYKTSIWAVENNKSGEELGLIKWHAQWRQYCFVSHSHDNYSIIYAQSCLRDIADFIKEQMDKRKK